MRIQNSPYIIAIRHTPDEYCELGTERFMLVTRDAAELDDSPLQWINEAENRRFIPLPGGVYDFPQLQKLAQAHNNKTGFLFWIAPRDRDDHQIGFVQLQLNPLHMLASVTTCIGDKAWWGTGAVGEARGAIMDFAFRKLSCEKVVATCQRGDAGALWSFHADGWTHEAIFRRHHRIGTERVDMLHFAMFRDEWMRRIDEWVANRKTDISLEDLVK
ncbi:MAG: GNAT family protein [Pseudomonadota bacterium]